MINGQLQYLPHHISYICSYPINILILSKSWGKLRRIQIINAIQFLSQLHCVLSPSGRPEITSTNIGFTVSRGDNTTMDCQFTSNPEQRIYKWQFLGTSIYQNTTDSHYIVTPNALSINDITPDDAGFYFCNVTNQCGSDTVPYTLEVIGKFMH
jgi:hypothetical protein